MMAPLSTSGRSHDGQASGLSGRVPRAGAGLWTMVDMATSGKNRLADQRSLQLSSTVPVGRYSRHEDAQAAVDLLAEREFPVQHLSIVGTDLRLVERVTGRRTWGTVLGQGVFQAAAGLLHIGTCA